MAISAHNTVIEASSELFEVLASFEEATNALLSRSPQSSAATTPETVTLRVAPDGRSPKSHDSSFPLFTSQSALSPSQTIPEGRVSVTMTSLAKPLPVFVTTIVKEAKSPALMVPFPTFEMTMSGHRTVTESEDWLGSGAFAGSLEASTVAVFANSPQS